MTQKNNIKLSIRKKIKDIESDLKAYEKVNATLSENTLNSVLKCLDLAEYALETGFINDSCNDVEKQFN